MTVNLYTAEEIAKLDATAAKKQVKRDAKNAVKAAVRAAEAAARRSDFLAVYGVLIERAKPHMEDSFIGDVISRGDANSYLSEAQADAVAKAIMRIEERAVLRAASKHVGKVGDRLDIEVTVSHVASFVRPCFNAEWRSETVWIVTMRDASGNAIVSKSTSFSANKNERLQIRATIKEHTSYNDEAQTVVQRVKAKTLGGREDAKGVAA